MVQSIASLFVGDRGSSVIPYIVVAELIACAWFVEVFRIDRGLNVFVVSWVGFRIGNSFNVFCRGGFEICWRGIWYGEDRGEEKRGGEELLEFHGDDDEAEVVQCPPTTTDT